MAQCFFPICFQVNVACIRPLGFQSDINLFPTLAQPFVFDFWPRPDSIIPMQKSYVLKRMVPYNRASPVCVLMVFLLVVWQGLWQSLFALVESPYPMKIWGNWRRQLRFQRHRRAPARVGTELANCSCSRQKRNAC